MTFAKQGLLASMALLSMLAAVPASAATFLFSYSGASAENSAMAVGSFDVADDAINANTLSLGTLKNFTMTVSGAGKGNGTFGASSFTSLLFYTPSALDLSKDLVGQTLANGTIFGSTGGIFGLFSIAPNSPISTTNFTLRANNGFGPKMTLTSLIATTAVPEPASWAMMILGLGMVGFALRRTRRAPRLAHA